MADAVDASDASDAVFRRTGWQCNDVLTWNVGLPVSLEFLIVKWRMRKQTRQLMRTWSQIHRMKMMSIRVVLFLIVGNFLYWFAGISLAGSLLAVFLVYTVTGGWRYLKVIILTLPRDVRWAFTAVRWCNFTYYFTGISEFISDVIMRCDY